MCRAVARSARDDVRRYVWSSAKSKVVPHRFIFTRNGAQIDLCHRDAIRLPRSEAPRVDIAVFDPPYFDYIAYDELSEFHRVWLNGEDLAGQPLLPRGVNRAEDFGGRLGQCLQALLSRMRNGRPLAFTYHGTEPDAWQAVGIAMDSAGLCVTALWPVRSDAHMGHHRYPGNSEWDVVLVCRRAADTAPRRLAATVEGWVTAVAPIPVNEADRKNFRLAIEMASGRFGRLKEETSR